MDKDKVQKNESSLPDIHGDLKRFTQARIALGRTGTSIPMQESLKIKLAHANARDAIYAALDHNLLLDGLEHFQHPILFLKSQANDRTEYLQRPDLGKKLHADSADIFKKNTFHNRDIAIIIADGLSSTAINSHAIPLLNLVIPQLTDAGFTLAPISIVKQARVALADEIGELLQSRLSLILIGERPGMSAPDSLGIYLTYKPRVGLTDDARNCISNIRKEGLNYDLAAQKTVYLVSESLKKGLSGVYLKDNDGLIG